MRSHRKQVRAADGMGAKPVPSTCKSRVETLEDAGSGAPRVIRGAAFREQGNTEARLGSTSCWGGWGTGYTVIDDAGAHPVRQSPPKGPSSRRTMASLMAASIAMSARFGWPARALEGPWKAEERPSAFPRPSRPRRGRPSSPGQRQQAFPQEPQLGACHAPAVGLDTSHGTG
jgi:hypothetical protein